MIRPTTGRVVWYQPSKPWDQPLRDQPFSATIAYVWNDRLVNLAYFDQNGIAHNATSVQLVQEGDTPNATGNFADWMPYQAAQAKKHDAIARVCHEVNRAYCQALGDHSHPSWDNAHEWQKDSAKLGVHFHLNNPDAGPQATHESWMAQKIADGWVYGPVKDPSIKQHPCIVPFNELPREQQAKDYIFRAVVHALK